MPLESHRVAPATGSRECGAELWQLAPRHTPLCVGTKADHILTSRLTVWSGGGSELAISSSTYYPCSRKG